MGDAWDTRGMWGIHYAGAFAYMHMNTPNSFMGDSPSATQHDRCIHNPPKMPCDGSMGTGWSNMHAAARSNHPGGVNVVFADGHVTFITDTIDLHVWQILGSIDDGQTVPAGYEGQ